LTGPEETDAPDDDPLLKVDAAPVAEAMVDALEEPQDWRRWLAVRDAIGKGIGKEHRYSEEQILYHYTKDRALLLL